MVWRSATVFQQYRTDAPSKDDLQSFHAQHFGAAPRPSEFFVGQPDQEYEEDDGLGHYPDGVKRTLTEEQVAMFRHSEIQAILRERRLEQEAFTHDKETEVLKSASCDKPHDANPKPRQSPDIDTNPTKRKWDNFINVSDANPDHLTHRRLARELDELQHDSVELAYGDEETPVVSTQLGVLRDESESGVSLQRPTFQWPTITVDSSAG